MIRISTKRQKWGTVVIIDGGLAAADLKELQRVRQSVPGKVILDLGGLDSCADDGIKLLRDWLNAGAQMVHAAPYLRMMLNEATPLGHKDLRNRNE